MDDKIEIPISLLQKKLLQQEVSNIIIDRNVVRAVFTVGLKGEQYYIYLNPIDLEELVGNVCFVANHEENNPKLVKQLGKLAEYLEGYIDD